MKFHAHQATRPLEGELRVPGDKSISHRAILFSAMAHGTSRVSGVLDSADVRSTIGAVQALGARVELNSAEDGTLEGTVTGWGASGPVAPTSPIDCGNSGTTTRLLLGVLAGFPVTVTLFGDESLSARPMARVTDPLEGMGARFTTREGCLPVTVQGAVLSAMEYESPVASAQVKSAILLAGLRAAGRTTVIEPAPSRDHTERLLPDFGVQVGVDPEACSAWVLGPALVDAATVRVPADPSSAAFVVVAALLVPGSRVVLRDVGLNPTRTGFLRVLERMGADIEVVVDEDSGSELLGTVTVSFTPGLTATTVMAPEVPSLVDEVPILAVAAASAEGVTRFEGVGELRVKESDRLAAICEALSAMGIAVCCEGDILEVTGSPAGAPPFTGAQVDSLGDHRLAMAWSVAGLAANGDIVVDRFESVDVSYPGFRDDMQALGAW